MRGEMEQLTVEAERSWSGNERNACFLNLGRRDGATAPPRFANVSGISGFDFPEDGRAIGLVDWDHDGDLDFWLTARTGPQLRFLRNDLNHPDAPGRNSISIRLVGNGTNTNRDAIGARVELLPTNADGQQRQIKSLHAGEGYLSQSSKWLHFGIGEKQDSTERSVTIRWPGGNTETIGNLVPGGRYMITQGSGTATIIPERIGIAPSNKTPNAPSVHPLENTGRAVFSTRFALPPIEFQGTTADDKRLKARNLKDYHGQPLLIVLWASWCAPCIAELGELAKESNVIRDTELRTLALNVEGTGETSVAEIADKAKAMLDKLSYSGSWGLIDQRAAEGIELFLNTMFVKQSTLTIPVSLLLDAEGKAVALYRGKVGVSTVLSDLEKHARAAPKPPFSGRQYAPAPTLSHYRLATRFAEQGRIEDSLFYLSQVDSTIDHSGDSYRASSFYNLAVSYGRSGKTEQAIENYRKVIDVNASFAPAHYNLGILLEKEGEDEEAIEHYRKAIEITGGHSDAANNLGLLYRGFGDFDKATACFREALDTDPSNVPALNNLANLLVVRGKYDEAEARLREAILIDAADPISHSNLGFLHDARGELEAASKAFRKAVELQPHNLDHHKNLAMTLAQEGKFDEAELAMRVGLSKVPGRADAAMKILDHIRRMRER